MINNPTDLHSWLNHQNWFHSIDFGNGLVSRGRFSKSIPPNYTIYGVYEFLKDIDLNGMTCMDIGTMDGIVALTLKSRGADHVIATDMAECKNFIQGCSLLGHDIQYITPIRMDTIPELLGPQKLDLIVNAGILYHVFNPVETLSICRKVLKKNGLLVLETQYLFDEKRPIMSFNPCDNSRRGNPNVNTFWRASKKTLEGMLELTGFKIITTAAVNGRITILAKACETSEINSEFPKMTKVHEEYMKNAHYREDVNYSNLGKEKSKSTIKYTGACSDRFIFRSFYKTDMPFQPKWNPKKTTRIKSFLNDLKFWIGTKLSRF